MTISPEAKEAARLMSEHFHFDAEFQPDFWERTVQLAINSATAPLQKEIERLKGEVEKAWMEATIMSDDSDTKETINENWNYSRARRVAEGKE